ncbi:hypothetical protein RFI_30902, partial [Reticulomyxa filosa]
YDYVYIYVLYMLLSNNIVVFVKKYEIGIPPSKKKKYIIVCLFESDLGKNMKKINNWIEKKIICSDEKNVLIKKRRINKKGKGKKKKKRGYEKEKRKME